MTFPRIQVLKNKLERNKNHVLAAFAKQPAGGWMRTVYTNPTLWTVRDLLAHFVSAEKTLLDLAKDISAGGEGAPEGFDYNEFNRMEQETYRSYAPEELLRMFLQARDSTMDWTSSLTEDQLDRKGMHPALGELTLEAVLTAIHGHILIHLRDL